MERYVSSWMSLGHAGQSKEELVPLYDSLISEEYKEFRQAQVDKEGEAAEFKEILDLMWVCIGYCVARGWPITEGWIELARSNFSKFATDEDGKLKVVRREDGKIKKPPTYEPADMQTILNKYKGV